jgi:diguanylate cyclase (GGDEF)-like protein
MKRAWEICENMDDLVFVSDVDTDEMVYMNRLGLNLNGFQRVEECRSIKRFELAAGFADSFIPRKHKRLKTGQFQERIYYNPLLERNYSIKETILADNNKLYRLEIVTDLTTYKNVLLKEDEQVPHESAIHAALQLAQNDAYPQVPVDILLSYIGTFARAERIYIFERQPDDTFSNTFEWCAEGIESQKEKLQNIMLDGSVDWAAHLSENSSIIVKSQNELSESDPVFHRHLRARGLHTLVVSPLLYKNKIIGFYGADNPPQSQLEKISEFLKIMGSFIVLLIQRHEMFQTLERLSFYDNLTGAGNRHATEEYTSKMDRKKSVGIVFADVNGLKEVNDSYGHKAGDKLLIQACSCLREVFSDASEELFRVGGDEFIVISSGISEPDFIQKLAHLTELSQKHAVSFAIGTVWRKDASENIEDLFSEADFNMYQNKREYYATHDRRRRVE